METGTITRVRMDKGFGFIRSGDDDYFFHCYELAENLPFDELLVERVVMFFCVETERGKRAVGIRPAF